MPALAGNPPRSAMVRFRPQLAQGRHASRGLSLAMIRVTSAWLSVLVAFPCEHCRVSRRARNALRELRERTQHTPSTVVNRRRGFQQAPTPCAIIERITPFGSSPVQSIWRVPVGTAALFAFAVNACHCANAGAGVGTGRIKYPTRNDRSESIAGIAGRLLRLCQLLCQLALLALCRVEGAGGTGGTLSLPRRSCATYASDQCQGRRRRRPSHRC